MYTSPQRITTNIGNNSFSFTERVTLLGEAKITIPSLHTIQTIEEIELGTDLVLEEIDETGTLHSCTGLKHLYKYEPNGLSDVPPEKGVADQERSDGFAGGLCPIHIFDNHNHALYFWIEYLTNNRHCEEGSMNDVAISGNISGKNIQLIHIDQHSDLNEPEYYLEEDQLNDIRNYTNHTCQISTFIKPFLHLYPETTFTRIKSESQLLTYQSNGYSSLRREVPRYEAEGLGNNQGSEKGKGRVLDIDLDFRAPEMSIEKFDKTIRITRQLIEKADLVTIATSPMFLDQSRALELLHILLD